MSTKDTLKNYNKLIDALKGKLLTNINIDDLYKIAKKELKDDSPYQIESYTPEIKDMNKLADCYSIGDWAYVLIGDDDSVNTISNKLKEVLSN
jgi:anionic cell wall polymer biosynthesis LytR-Cps2A-Psr (LCP) family protein